MVEFSLTKSKEIKNHRNDYITEDSNMEMKIKMVTKEGEIEIVK